jgi:hypothetical protein
VENEYSWQRLAKAYELILQPVRIPPARLLQIADSPA